MLSELLTKISLLNEVGPIIRTGLGAVLRVDPAMLNTRPLIDATISILWASNKVAVDKEEEDW